MSNECLNLLRIEAPLPRLEELLRGPSPLDGNHWGAGSVPAVFALMSEASAHDWRDALRLTRVCMEVRFESRWDPPEDLVAHFARDHADVVVDHLWAEPSLAVFGRRRYERGLVVVVEDFAYESEAEAAFTGLGWDYDCDARVSAAMLTGAMRADRNRG